MLEFRYHDINRLSTGDVLKRLETTESGLTTSEATRRITECGPNVLSEPSRCSVLRGFTRQFTHFLAILLWIAAGLAFTAELMKPGEGMATLAWAILGVIIINAVFAFLQEYKAERAVQALRRLLPDKAWVTRNGQSIGVPRSELVPGDVLLLEEGERVPADARLIEATGIRVDTAALTGESKPKRRTAEPVEDGHWLDLQNLVFAGATILSGHGRAVVFASGMHTEFGKIADLTTAVETGFSPLQKEIVKVTRIVAAISLAMGATFFVIGFATGWTWGVRLDWSSPLLRSATTVTFAGIVLAQVANVFACRSDRRSIFTIGWFTNPLIFWGIAVELAILIIISYTTVGNTVFGTSPLPLWIFGALILGAFVCLLAEEARKLIVSRLGHQSPLGPIRRAAS